MTPEQVGRLAKKAQEGDAQARFNLGTNCFFGKGVPQDDTEAVKRFRMAAEGGLAQAQHSLGVCYDQERGVRQSDAEAAR